MSFSELKRPQVRVTQSNPVSESDVRTPEQLAVRIGPLYQTVSPTLPAGGLDPASLLKTPAVLRSTVALGQTLNVQGKTLAILVNGGSVVFVQFPATLDGDGLSRQLVASTILKAVPTVTVSYEEDKLVISTGSAVGTSASLLLAAIDAPAVEAYTDLGLLAHVGLLEKGGDGYTGSELEIRYVDFPSSKAPVDEITIDPDSVRVFALSNKRLVEFKRGEAVNAAHEEGGVSKVGGTGAHSSAVTGEFAPAFTERSSLLALPDIAATSNRIMHVGRDARATIPLACDRLSAGGPHWPDTLGNALHVRALGLEAATEPSKAGSYVGALGNDIQVAISNGGAEGSLAVSWAADTLTITAGDWDGEHPSFTDLANALAAVDFGGDLEVTVNYDGLHANEPFVPDEIGGSPTALRFWLSGGQNPHNFSVAATTKGGLCGAVRIAETDTAAALGVDGEWIDISVDGGRPVRVALSGVLANGVNGVFDLIPGLTAEVVEIAPNFSNAVSGELTSNKVPVLRLVSDGVQGPASSVAITAVSSSHVIPRLFAGSSVASDVVTVASTDDEGLVFELVSGSAGNYNTRASTPLERALEYGRNSFLLQDLVFAASIVIPYTDVSAIADDSALVIQIEGAAGTLSITPDWTTAANATALAAEIDALFVGDYAALSARTLLRGGNYSIVITDGSLTPGTAFSLVQAGTAAGLVTAITADRFGKTVETKAGMSIVVADRGTDYAMSVTAVGSLVDAAAAINLPNSMSLYSESSITSLFLDGSAINYADGAVTLSLAHDSVSDALPLAVAFVDGVSSVTVSAAKASPNIAGKSVSYLGRPFFGGHVAVTPGDFLIGPAGRILGRVMSIESLTVSGVAHAGCVLVLSEYSARKGEKFDSWLTRSTDILPSSLLRPDLVLNQEAGSVSVSSRAIRSLSDAPVRGGLFPIYLGYRALRRDVSSTAKDPVLWEFATIQEVDALWGPITPDNPLAYALYMAFLNAPNSTHLALGVDEVSVRSPMGTLPAYARAFEYLGLTDRAYFLAPLAQDVATGALLKSHVEAMSEADEAFWRMGVTSIEVPTEVFPLVAASSLATVSGIGGGKFEVVFDEPGLNLASALDGMPSAGGGTTSGAIGQDYGPADGVFVQFATHPARYRVSKIAGADTLEVDTSSAYNPGGGPGTSGNDDGFYEVDPSWLEDFPAAGDQCAVYVRQSSVDITTQAGKTLACEALAASMSALASRRCIFVGPGRILTPVMGSDVPASSAFAASGLAALMSSSRPQTNLTGSSIVGVSKAIGSDDVFSERRQLAVAAGAGVTWLVSDGKGQPPVIRHYLTSDTSTIDSRQPGVTRQIDYVSKTIKVAGTRFMRGRIVSQATLDQLALLLSSLQARLTSNTDGVVQKLDITKIEVQGRVGVVVGVRVVPWDALDAIDVEIVF